jgi:hypothetical protein
MTTRAEDGISRVTMGQIIFGLPRFGPLTSYLCIVTLTIIAATIGPALRNTLDSTPKNIMIEVVIIEIMIIEAVIIEVVDVINVRRPFAVLAWPSLHGRHS